MNANSKISDDSYDLFISYGRGDDIPFVEKLYNDLSEHGYKVWFDTEKLESNGRSFLQNIRDPLAINERMRLLLVVGPHASRSEYVRFEWEFALANCIVVIPLLRMGDQKDDKGFSIASNTDYDWMPGPIKKRNFHAIDFRKERSYEDAFKELLNNLSNPILPLCKLNSVPNKPANFIDRDDEVKKIKQIVLGDNYKPGVITSVGKSTAVQGMGGIGKSVLAASVCHDCDVRRSFSDGIFWVTVGQQQPELNVTKAVQRLTGDYSINLSNDVDEAKNKLRESLKQKNCLIVLDDVWKQQDIAIFPSDEALRCRLLITTRNKQAVEYLSSNILEVDLLNKEDALRLLAKAASNSSRRYTVEEIPLEADEITKECGNLPLAIAMAGGMISGGGNKKWQSVLTQLRTADLTEISKKFPDYPYPNLYRVLDASVTALEAESREEDATRAMRNAYSNYLKLAIFKEDTIIPKSIIELLWRDESFFDTDTDNLLDILVARSLIQRNKEDNYTLHDLQLDYLKKTCTDIKQSHKDFLNKLGNPLKMTDIYAWNNYIWHLTEAGKKEDAIKLLSNYNWIQGKLTATGNLYEITSDYELLPPRDEIMLIQKALLLSAAVIVDDPAQLPHQLYGRLGELQQVVCRQLAEQALASIAGKEMSLIPLHPSLEIPDLHNLIFRGHTSSVMGALVQGDTLISWSADNTLRSWDILSGKTKQVFEGHANGVVGALIQDDILISWSADRTLRSWDILSGRTKLVFEGHSNYVSGALIQGNTLISWSDDNTLRSWDILSGKTKQIFEGHSNHVSGALIQGYILISWSEDNTLRSWDILSGKINQVFEGHSGSVYGALVQDDTLISWSEDNTLRSWDILSGKTKQVLWGLYLSFSNVLIQGNTFISHTPDYKLNSWDIRSGEVNQVFEGHSGPVSGALIQGDTLISWSQDNTLRSWDILSGKPKQIFEGHSSFVSGALIQGDTLISWSYDYTFRSWDTLSGKTKQVFEGHSRIIWGALTQGNTLISWSDDNTLRAWDILSEKTKRVFEGHTSFVSGALIQGDTLISCSEDKTLRSWDTHLGKPKQVFEGHSKPVWGALIESDTLISWSNDNTLRSWDIFSGKTKQVFEGHSGPVSGALIQGDTLISWSYDGTLRSWDTLSGKTKQVFEGHSGTVSGALIQGDILISWSSYGTLRSWDILSGGIKQVFEEHSSDVSGALIQAGTLISWSDNTLRSWDILSGKTKQVFEGHTDNVRGTLIKDEILISWSNDRTLRSWDILSGKTKKVFEGHTSWVSGALIKDAVLLSMSGEELLVRNLLGAENLRRLEIKTIQINIEKDFLFLTDRLNTVWIYRFPTLEYICRYTVDFNITAFQIVGSLNRIFLGDASGRVHFLEPVGFYV